jgi:glutathione synthase
MPKVAIQMDDIASIHPLSDSTLLLGVEACNRGYEVYYYPPEMLTYNAGELLANGHSITLRDDPNDYYTLTESHTLSLKEMDVILIRQDPPFDMAYITNTYLLELIADQVKIVNHPAAIRNAPEKWFLETFPEFTLPTLITRNEEAIHAFHKEHKALVAKPLYGYGGKSIFHIDKEGKNLDALLEHMFELSKEPLLFQPFLPNVKEEEKRIILLDGKVAGAIGRIPADGEIRSNMRVGGKAVKTELTHREIEIGNTIGPVLKDMGIILAGVDVIGDYLTEINVTSPTGLRPINQLYNIQTEKLFWDAVIC